MKTLILTAVLIILALHGGRLAFSIHTKHKARAWMLLYLLGNRFTVQFEMTPLWAIAEQVGAHRYCDRIYSVNVQVAR